MNPSTLDTIQTMVTRFENQLKLHTDYDARAAALIESVLAGETRSNCSSNIFSIDAVISEFPNLTDSDRERILIKFKILKNNPDPFES